MIEFIVILIFLIGCITTLRMVWWVGRFFVERWRYLRQREREMRDYD